MLDKMESLRWIKQERLPLFLDSDCYHEYQLAKLISQVKTPPTDNQSGQSKHLATAQPITIVVCRGGDVLEDNSNSCSAEQMNSSDTRVEQMTSHESLMRVGRVQSLTSPCHWEHEDCDGRHILSNNPLASLQKLLSKNFYSSTTPPLPLVNQKLLRCTLPPTI